METRMDPCLLWARAAIVGSIAFVLGVVGHVTADGLLPGPTVLAVMLSFAVVLSAPMLSRPASRTRLLVMLVGGQALNHLVLTLTAGHAGDRVAAPHPSAPPGVPPGIETLPVLNGHRVGSLQDAFTAANPTEGDRVVLPALPVGHLINDLSAHKPMMVAHLLAAAAVALWLAYGERCLWTILAITGRRITLIALTTVPALPSTGSLRDYARHSQPAGVRSVWLTRPASRRGPPLLPA